MGNQVKLDRCTSSTLPIDGDFGRITSERRDVLLDPLQCLHLIVEARIQVPETLRRHLGGSEKPDRVKAVVHGSDDNVRRLVNPMIERPVGGVAIDVTAAMNVDKHWHWQPASVSCRLGRDILTYDCRPSSRQQVHICRASGNPRFPHHQHRHL